MELLNSLLITITKQTPSNNLIKLNKLAYNLILNYPSIYFIKLGIRKFSTKPNNTNLNIKRKNSCARWLYGYNPNKIVISSILLKEDVLFIFDHTNLEIVHNNTINLFKIDRKNLIDSVIVNWSAARSIYSFNIISYIFNCGSNEYFLNKEQIVIVSDFLFDSRLKNFYENQNIELVPVSKYKTVPPITFYILKNIHSNNLEKKIINKIFNKKENYLKKLYYQHKSLYDY